MSWQPGFFPAATILVILPCRAARILRRPAAAPDFAALEGFLRDSACSSPARRSSRPETGSGGTWHRIFPVQLLNLLRAVPARVDGMAEFLRVVV